MSLLSELNIAIAGFTVLVGLTFALFLFLLYRLGRWMVRSVSTVLDRGSLPLFANLVAFAVALLTFPDVVVHLLHNLSETFKALVANLGLMVSSTPAVIQECRAQNSVESCLSLFAYQYLASIRQITLDPISYLLEAEIPLENLIFFLVIWLVVAAALMLPTDARIKGALIKFRGGMVSWASSPARLKNLMLLTILTLAGYLSFTAIASLPGLKVESIPDQVGMDKLKAALEQFSSSTTAATDDSILPEINVDHSLYEIDEDAPPELRFQITILKVQHNKWIEREKPKHQNLISIWSAVQEEFLSRQRELLNTGLRIYETENLRRFGFKETVSHFQDISSWYISQIASGKNTIAECRGWIINYARGLDDLRQAVVGAIADISRPFEDAKLNPVGTSNEIARVAGRRLLGLSTETSAFRQAANSATEAYYTALEKCRIDWNLVPPERGKTGSETLGIVGNAAGWLLETESVPIVLVVGMIGFGLLGATFSTFVRERQSRKKGDPLVEDLAGVVIRGLSAAIVVFLGIYGGLSVMTASAEPDPYLVFFICLVGAVFSDVVWEWAQGRLRIQLGEEAQVIENQQELGTEESFYFRGPENKMNLRAANLREFLRIMGGVDNYTWLHHLRSGDYSRWFRETIRNRGLADQIAEIERVEEDATVSRTKVQEAITKSYPKVAE